MYNKAKITAENFRVHIVTYTLRDRSKVLIDNSVKITATYQVLNSVLYYLYRSTVHFVLYFSNTPTNTHTFS